MAASYYIYIKSERTETSNNFSPKKPTTPIDIDDEELGITGSAIAKLGAKFKGLGIAAILVATAQTTLKATEAVSSYMSKETGSYVFNRDLNNALSTIHALTNPIGTTINIINQNQEIRLTNQRLSEQRVLLGDSSIIQSARRV